MILGVHHIGLSIAAPQALGWLDHVCSSPDGLWREAPNVRVRLSATSKPGQQVQAPRPVNLPGIAHICLQSRDIDEGLAIGKKNGLIAISSPVDLGTDFRYLYAHTLEGVLLELEGAPFVSDLAPRFWIGHVAFVAVDLVPLVEFYGRVLDLTPSPVSRLRGSVLFDRVTGLDDVDLGAMWLPGFNLGLEFWQYHAPALQSDAPIPASGFTSVCFQTDDFDTDCQHALSQGAQLAEPPDLGLTNVQVAGFTDPEGNHFDLLAFKDPSDVMSINGLAHADVLARVTAQRLAIPKR